MPILVDINVRDDVAEVFCERGHDVVLARNRMDDTAPDEEIVVLADELAAIVVTWDKDFSRLISRRLIGRQRFRYAGRISFIGCRYEIGRRRLERFIELIEVEWALAQGRRDKRLIVVVRPHQCVVEG